MSQTPADSDKEAVGQQGHGTAAPARTGRSDARRARRCLWRHRHQPDLRFSRGAARCVRRWTPPCAMEILGVLSLIVWALTIIVTIKYVVFVLRADNQGEGGTLSLMALARRAYPRASTAILIIGICGAALFFGDAIITPAISVLSAVEGLEGRDAGLRALCRADHARDPGDAVSRSSASAPAAWRSCSARSPPSGSWRSALPACRTSSTIRRCCWRAQPLLCDRLSSSASRTSPSSPSARCSWRSPAPRRSMSTSAISAASRSCSPGLAIVFPCLLLNYFGQGAFVLAHDGTPQNPVLRDAAGLGAAADGGPGDGRDRHRQPGGHFRRLSR